MPHLTTVSLRSTFGKSWKLSRHPKLRLHLDNLFPFPKTEFHNTKPSSSFSPSSSSCSRKKKKRRFRGLLLILKRPKWQSVEMDKVGGLPEFSPLSDKVYPSPVTPAYVKSMTKRGIGGGAVVEAEEDACKCFEKYVVEMIVNDGKMGDLTDVEELLYCWQNLRCPVYIEMVCQFYAEMCEDLFSPTHEELNL